MIMRQLLTCLTILIACAAPSEGADTPQTNFVVFLADDLGWGDLGCYGHPEIKTPHLDKFATEGLKLTQCYSACAVCSPSRSSILTGRTPYRNGVWRWIPEGSQYHLRTSEVTAPTLLKRAGYDTCHAGKWHLNGKFNSDEQPQPDDHGYDHWLATQNNAAPHHLNPTNYVRNREPVGRMEGPSAVLAANEAITWLRNREDPSTPFFITVWTHEPHLPIESAERYMQPYAHLEDPDLRQHHGNVTQLDDAFGQLMTALDELGYRDNTFVMFTSDNGPEGNGYKGRTRGSTGGLRGRKRHSHEGGIRVPGIVRWPGKIDPGSESDVPVIGSDIFSTVLEIAGVSEPDDRIIDGTSLVPLFSGRPLEREQPLYWRNHLAPQESRVALRIGDWKVIGSDDLSRFELYNIADDWQETNNLETELPDKFAEMSSRLIEYDRSVLQDGPDWWKDDQQPPRRKRSAALAPGEDQTGRFDIVRGGVVKPSEFGIALTTDSEALALIQLDQPIARGTFQLRYQSAQQTGQTRNAFFCFGNVPTNEDTFKIGTAIGMHQHVAFQGGWGNVGSLARKTAEFEPLQTFTATIQIDVPAGEVIATIDGEEIKARIPRGMKSIEYYGIYAKDTLTEFAIEQVQVDETTHSK